MRFLRNWLRVERPAGITLHPARTLELEAPQAQLFESAVAAIQNVLGGHVNASDAALGTIEASFGLVASERLTVTLQSLDESRTRVRIESRRGALSEPPKTSSYVDTLARALTQSAMRE